MGLVLVPLIFVGTWAATMLLISLPAAFVVQAYWRWFVVPLGLPALGVVQAFGLMILINLLRQPTPQDREPSENPWGMIAATVGGAWVGLLLAYILGAFLSTL